MIGKSKTPFLRSVAVRISLAAGLLVWSPGCWMSHANLDLDASDGGRPEDRTAPDHDARDARDDAPDDHDPPDGGRPEDRTAPDHDARDARDDAPDDAVVDDGGEAPCVDEDGDGHPSLACGGDDCDDGDPTIFPGADDVCGDGCDSDCDGLDGSGSTEGPPVLVLDHAHISELCTNLLWTGDEYIFLWRQGAVDGIFMRRLDSAGEPVGDEVRLRSYENAFDVAWGSSRLGTAWVSGSAGATNVMFQTFDQLGTPLSDAVTVRSFPDIGTASGVMGGPRIAALGDDFLLLWSEATESSCQIRLVRMDVAGVPRADPVTVGSCLAGNVAPLSLGTSGDSVVALWATETGLDDVTSRVLSRAYSAELLPLAAEQILDDRAGYSETDQTLGTGSEFVALWSHAGRDDAEFQMHVALLDGFAALASDAMLDPPATGHYREFKPVVWNRGFLVVLWNDFGSPGATGLTLSRFATDGARHGASIVIPTERWPGRLHLVTTGEEYGFIWSYEDPSTYHWHAYFQRATFCD